MILESPFYEKANYFNDHRLNAKKLAVGDWVYYIPDTNKYSIKKSRIKEMHVTKGRWPLDNHWGRWPLDNHCNLLLENGATVEYDGTFNSKEDALEYITASLKRSIVWNKQELVTLQKEIEKKERLLNLFERKQKSLE